MTLVVIRRSNNYFSVADWSICTIGKRWLYWPLFSEPRDVLRIKLKYCFEAPESRKRRKPKNPIFQSFPSSFYFPILFFLRWKLFQLKKYDHFEIYTNQIIRSFSATNSRSNWIQSSVITKTRMTWIGSSALRSHSKTNSSLICCFQFNSMQSTTEMFFYPVRKYRLPRREEI